MVCVCFYVVQEYMFGSFMIYDRKKLIDGETATLTPLMWNTGRIKAAKNLKAKN